MCQLDAPVALTARPSVQVLFLLRHPAGANVALARVQGESSSSSSSSSLPVSFISS